MYSADYASERSTVGYDYDWLGACCYLGCGYTCSSSMSSGSGGVPGYTSGDEV